MHERPQKIFTRSNTHIPKLANYNGTLPDKYWQTWEKKTYHELMPSKSWIDPNKLLGLAQEISYKDREGRLKRALERLRKGAEIGCKGPSRLPTSYPNSTSTMEYGVRVADSLQSWIKEGLCFGPLERKDMPWDDFTTNSITVKVEPNGKTRIGSNIREP